MVLCKHVSGQLFALKLSIVIGGLINTVDGVKTTAEGYVAPAIIALLNLMVLITGWDLLFKI